MPSDIPYDTQPRVRRWPWVLLCLVLVVIALDQGYRLYVKSKVQRELATMRQEGYPTSERELVQWLAPVPDTSNAALRLIEAAGQLSLPPDAFSISWGRTDELGPEERDELKSILTNNASALQLVHAAAQLKQSRFPVNYESGPSALLPHLAKVKSLTQLLKAEAVIQAEEGHLDLAVDSLRDALAIGRSLDTEPLLISQLVRIASLAISGSTLERLLTQYTLTDAQLEELTRAFREAGDASQPAFARGFLGEVCLGSYCFTASPSKMVQILGQDGSGHSSQESAVAQIAFPLYAWTGLRDRDYLFYLHMMDGILGAAKAPFPQSLSLAREVSNLVEKGTAASKFLIFSRMLLPALQKSIDKSAEEQGRLRSAEVALAIERYRLKEKALPESLDQLVPAWLAKVPDDPIDGAPLRYRKLDPGYVVYSVGLDGTDEGGAERSRLADPGNRPQPSSKKGSNVAKHRPPKVIFNKQYDITFTVER